MRRSRFSVVGARLAEQPADDRQVDEERNSRLGLRGLRTVRPPITAVSPSPTRSWVSPACLPKMKPTSDEAS